MGLIRTTVVGGVVLGAIVWIMSPWVAKMDIVQAATSLDYAKVAARMDLPAMSARQAKLIDVMENAKVNEHPTLAFAAGRAINIDSLMLVSSHLRSDPEYRRFMKGEENAEISSGFWRGFTSFSFQIAGTNPDRRSGVLKIRMSFRFPSMSWQVVGIELHPS